MAVGFWFNAGMESSAEVHLNEDGTVQIIEGNPDIGGSRASMALMAAETLGVPYEKIRVLVGDTEASGFNAVTGGSRTTFATGMAVIQACEDVIAQCKERAAATWGVDADQVAWEDGQAIPVPGVNAELKPLSLAEIMKNAARTGGPILGRASLNARGAGAGFSVNFGDLQVDDETGKVDVLSYTAIQDAGKAIHPSYVEGQMQGGAVQGLGWALNEEYVFNDDGVLENPGFLDYRIPGCLRHADDRYPDHRGAEPEPPLRGARRRRDAALRAAGRGGKRGARCDRRAGQRSAAVAAECAGSARQRCKPQRADGARRISPITCFR